MLIPRQKTPPLKLSLIGGGEFDLDRQSTKRGTLMVVYRGLHCPICITQLREIDRHAAEIEEKGVGTLALSTDDEARTAEMMRKVGAKKLRFAHGFSLEAARDWGLYLSTGRGKTSTGIEEPAIFAEPGLFLVWPDRMLYWASVQTMPFSRPPIAELIRGLDMMIGKDYPARGEYTGPV